jgi:ketopantoate reductase
MANDNVLVAEKEKVQKTEDNSLVTKKEQNEGELLQLMLSSIQMNAVQSQATEIAIKELINAKNDIVVIKEEMVTFAKENREELEEIREEIKDNIHLSPAEIKKVKEAVEFKVRQILRRKPHHTYKKVAQNIWRGLYTYCGVNTVYFIKRAEYQDVLDFIGTFHYDK